VFVRPPGGSAPGPGIVPGPWHAGPSAAVPGPGRPVPRRGGLTAGTRVASAGAASGAARPRCSRAVLAAEPDRSHEPVAVTG
jgi:hypothetical protein